MTTTFDSHQNLAYTSVATAPSPATSGTSLVVTTGGGALFPAPPFNAVVWPGGGATASQSNAEYVRVTAISTDTFTIIRAQEGSTAQSIGVGYQLALVTSKKVITDIENAINATLGGSLSGTLPNPSIASAAVGTTQLAANAVTQDAFAAGSTADPTTTSTTFVDLPDMALTLSTTGGDLLVWLHADVQNDTASGAALEIALSLDGAAEVAASIYQPANITQSQPFNVFYRFAAPSAGSHTVKGRWLTGVGTAHALGTRRYMLALETKR